MSLKAKAVSGVLWNSVGTFSQLILEFGIGILLARILSPAEFGLVGMITVFIAISDLFINSGMSQALVRKKECTQDDYSTAFFFNLFLGVFFCSILFMTAPLISQFYNEPKLIGLIRVLGCGLIISALTLVQRAVLIRKIDFKLQSKITVTSSVISGCIAVTMALNGWGVWSLVVKTLSRDACNSALLWVFNKWKPRLVFNMESFKALFGFGSKLLISGLIGTVFSNLNYIIIGKYFSPADLGFYTRAELFKNLPSQNIESIMSGVAYPVLAKVQDDPVKLREGFRRLLLSAVFIVTICMAMVAAVAEPLIIGLIGEKWRQSIIYLQLLSIVGVMYPLNSININILNIIGRSDLYMKLQFVVQITSLPVILVGVWLGIKAMILGLIFNAILGYFVFSFVSSKYTGYTTLQQIRDLAPNLLLAILWSIGILFIGQSVHFPPIITLITQVIIGTVLLIVVSEMSKSDSYLFIRNTVISKIRNL